MVIGYGRIGKILTKMLNGIGANVFPVVKEREEEALANSYGYSTTMYEDMDALLGEMDIIFNTVPKLLLDGKNIKYVMKKALIVDLSSPPYGIDFDAAKEAGLKVLFTGSLPGSIAPYSTAGYIKSTIYNYLSEIEK